MSRFANGVKTTGGLPLQDMSLAKPDRQVAIQMAAPAD
jgi:hypothetical protein